MHVPTPETDAAMGRALEYVRERLRTPKDPRWGAAYVPDVAGRLEGTITADGIGAAAALDLFERVVVPSCRPNDDPNMLAYVPTAPTVEARLLDVVLGSVTIFAGHWEAGAGAIAAENQALAWVASLAGLPSTAGGCFVSGGSAANLSALVTARYAWREHRLPGEQGDPSEQGAHGEQPDHSEAPTRGRGRRLRIAVTEETHASLAACARVMDVDLVLVPTDDQGRMLVGELRDILAADAPSPSVVAVVATAGTTACGVIDDLAAIADACRQHEVWLHVDGAYGGAALCAPSGRRRFAGIDRADSLSVDPHKWFYAPYDCAVLLYRDPALAAAAHTQEGNYLQDIDRNRWNPADYAFHLSRRARGLPFWFSVAANGTAAYQRAVEGTLQLADELADMVEARDYLRLRARPELSIVLFRRVGWAAQDYADWSTRLSTASIAFINPIVLHGETHARICIVNPLTSRELLEQVLDSMR